jgi:hypothetical protein
MQENLDVKDIYKNGYSKQAIEPLSEKKFRGYEALEKNCSCFCFSSSLW